MNLSLFSSETLLHFFIFFTIFTSETFSLPRQTISYSDHCNAYAPEAIPTDKMFTRFPFLEPVTSHYTGGQSILDQDPQSQRSILFEATHNIFRTNVIDTYKIQARLSFLPSRIYNRPSRFPSIRSSYPRAGWVFRHALVFNLDGFWSVSRSKLCMVGSTLWFTKEGNRVLTPSAVLKLKFSRFINLNNSLVSGTLESLASPNDLDYFDPISFLGFPRVAPFKYNYSLVSNEECNKIKPKTPQDSVTSMRSLDICSIFTRRFITYKLEYPTNCKNCSLIGQDDGYLPTSVSLYAIQCSREDKKLRFLILFQDRRFTPYDQSFEPDTTLIGEGTWNGTKDKLCIIACRILNQSDPLGSAHVGDCSTQLTLWFPAVRSITETHNTEGQIWTTKLTDDSGLFKMAKFKSFDHSPENYGLKYKYTQMEKVQKVCPKKKHVGNTHRFGYYSGFDMFVKHRSMVSRGSAVPVSDGSRVFNGYTNLNPNFGPWINFSTTTYSALLDISFEISFMLNTSSVLTSGISSLNLSTTDNDRVEISAEGVYDDETGHICMVGCRNLKNASFDCEILVQFQLPSGNESLIKGSIKSLRRKTDVLYFESLKIFSLTPTKTEAREHIWRMDLEIIMVLFSGTLMCVLTGRQLFHLKKKPEMVNFISVLMMLILTLGHMVPLVLNFEAVFSNTKNQQNVPIRGNGLLKVNEVIIRVVSMVAFILQSRLLQLTWTAKRNHWIHEIRTLVICLPIYLIGGSAMLLMNSKNTTNDTILSQVSGQNQHFVWGGLRSYAGLILDGFLFPQLILNIFQISKGNALSHGFYTGTTFVRLLPHAYDLYRGQNYISHQFNKLNIYANPRVDFYSPSWDIIIVCGGLLSAVVVFLQQRFGGRFMFPKRFQEHAEYEMVPVTSNEQSIS